MLLSFQRKHVICKTERKQIPPQFSAKEYSQLCVSDFTSLSIGIYGRFVCVCGWLKISKVEIWLNLKVWFTSIKSITDEQNGSFSQSGKHRLSLCYFEVHSFQQFLLFCLAYLLPGAWLDFYFIILSTFVASLSCPLISSSPSSTLFVPSHKNIDFFLSLHFPIRRFRKEKGKSNDRDETVFFPSSIGTVFLSALICGVSVLPSLCHDAILQVNCFFNILK